MNSFGPPSRQWIAQVQAASRRLQMGSVWQQRQREQQQRERRQGPYLTNQYYEPGDGYRYQLYYDPATGKYFY